MNQQTLRKFANVSVVIPCYQCSHTLPRAVASIARQTVLPLEVILIDDASPDDGITLQMMHDLVKEYSGVLNIKMIRLKENRGVASARNAGWNIATQPYIALLDADDAWHPEKLEIQYSLMLTNPDVALSGHGVKLVTDLELPSWKISCTNHRIIKKNRLLLSNAFVTPSVMFKRSLVLRFNDKKRHMEDFLLWLEIAFNNFKVAKINADLVAVYKPMFGASGLSANLWAMEKAQLDNYWRLYQQNYINIISLAFLIPYSFAKYIRRVMIVKLRAFNFGK